ncbi:MAG TPA: pyridoxamine 5'-phosphate oxidase family protein [Candidatus Saccharimonadales bacterium]
MSTIAKEKIKAYLKTHPAMVVSTINKGHTPHGAVVYIFAPTPETLYFMTKTETEKYKNLAHSTKISLTTFDETDNSTLQATGTAEIVNDHDTIGKIMSAVAHLYQRSPDSLPPLTKFKAGDYAFVKVTLTHARLAQFGTHHAGDKRMFTEFTSK